jgi:hypothetical protein
MLNLICTFAIGIFPFNFPLSVNTTDSTVSLNGGTPFPALVVSPTQVKFIYPLTVLGRGQSLWGTKPILTLRRPSLGLNIYVPVGFWSNSTTLAGQCQPAP